jgi:methionyl-tRNA formyltransferase
VSAALRVIFAGTPEFSVPALEGLLGSQHYVCAVYTQPDRPAGRGQHVAMSAVKQCALKHGIAVEQPATLRDATAVEKLEQWRADVMIVVAYGLILPPAVLAIPPLGCINIHASLLPRWRGAAPIQRAILAGDTESGVAIMRMEAGLDTGPILLERRTALAARETAGSLHDRLAASGADALLEALVGVVDGSIEPRAQSAEGVTYAAKINKQEALIDWSSSARAIDRQIRAFNPWPIAETRWQGQQLRVWEASPEGAASDAPPGSVIAATAEGIRVSTGDGVLNITRVQLAGRKAVAAAEFINAHRMDAARLGIT